VFRVNLGAELGAVMRERDDLKRRLAEKCDYDAVAKERDDAFGASRGMFNAITGGNYLITGGNYLGFGTEAAVKAARDLKSERDRLAAECEGLEAENKRFAQDRNDAQAWSRVYRADAVKYAAERDAAVLQTTNRDCQIIALRAERDTALATAKLYKKEYDDADAAIGDVPTYKNRLDGNIRALRAERDALKATVERAGNLTRYRADIGVRITDVVEADDLRRALAEPVEDDSSNGWFTRNGCVHSREQRGTTGHDARGRRHEDTHNCVRYTPLTWDRRKANRRA